jgi:thioredoxin-related protein
MKVFFLAVLFIAGLGTSNWQLDFEAAKIEARHNNKMILLNFSGSDWCAPCIKMKKDVFDQAEFGDYADKHLVLVRADFPRHKKNKLSDKQTNHNEALAEKYNPQGKFPLTLLLNAEGKVIQTWDGFSGGSAGEFVKQLDKNIHGK